MVNHDVSRFSFRKRKAQALPTRWHSVSFREEAPPTSGNRVAQIGVPWSRSLARNRPSGQKL